jgi:hypothetical protein
MWLIDCTLFILEKRRSRKLEILEASKAIGNDPLSDKPLFY